MSAFPVKITEWQRSDWLFISQIKMNSFLNKFTHQFFVDVLDLKKTPSFLITSMQVSSQKLFIFFLIYEMLQWWLLIIKGQSFK